MERRGQLVSRDRKGASLSILDEAKALVDGDRQDVYGHPALDFTAVSKAAGALGVNPAGFGGADEKTMALHHALYMVLVKIQRLVQSPSHRDSVVDGAGYFYTYQKVLDRMNDGQEK